MKKAYKWIVRAKESKLKSKDTWFLLTHKIFSWISYGLCCIGAPWKQLTSALGNFWYKILPKGAVIRLDPRELRQLSSGFVGVGCPHVGVECLVQQIAKLHTNYRRKSNMGSQVEGITGDLGGRGGCILAAPAAIISKIQ